MATPTYNIGDGPADNVDGNRARPAAEEPCGDHGRKIGTHAGWHEEDQKYDIGDLPSCELDDDHEGSTYKIPRHSTRVLGEWDEQQGKEGGT